MGIKSFFNNVFNRDMKGVTGIFATNITPALYYLDYSVQVVASHLADTVSMVEFKTIQDGKAVKLDDWFLLNIQPNHNMNSCEFWNKVVYKLIYDNECLVIKEDDQLLICDDFTRKEMIYKPNYYSNILIGDLSKNKIYTENEVLYFKLNNKDIATAIQGLYNEYSTLLGSAMTAYKRQHGRKGTLKIKSMFSQLPTAQEKLQDLLDNKFKKFFESDFSVLPLHEGMEYSDLPINQTVKNSREIKDLFDDILSFVCGAYHVPISIIKGDMVGIGDITDNYLMFAINPILSILKTEITRKFYSKKDVLKGTSIVTDIRKIKNVDLQKLASASDIFFRIGVNSINDNLELLDREPIKEKWADEHYVTKNYQSVLNPNLKGGDDNNGKATNRI